MRTPESTFREQARRVRARWSEPARRPLAIAAVSARPASDPTNAAWTLILAGNHPLADWMNGIESVEVLPDMFPDGTTPRLLFASHPFLGPASWLIQPTSPVS